MSNVTVQEALKSEDVYIFDINQPFVTQEQKFKYWEESKAEIKRLKAALSEIDKREPVDWLNSVGNAELFVALKNIDGSVGYAVDHKDAIADYTSPKPIEKREPVAYISNDAKLPLTEDGSYWLYPEKLEYRIALYDKPQPRDWVGLNYPEILDCLPEGAKRVPEGWQEFYEAIEAKLKQLNTKG